MVINVHAGHNPDGKIACGAIGLIKESTEARTIKDKVVKILKDYGHTVYDCTVDNGTNQNDVLTKIVNKCNSHKVDMDISIHCNSGRNDYVGDGSTGGTEVWVYNNTSKLMDEAVGVCTHISNLGFKNRGVKTNSNLYVLNKTHAPAMLIECCFVDDADDVKLYNSDLIAKAIAEGILNTTISTSSPIPPDSNNSVTANEKNFLIKVTDSALNIRSGPGMTYKIVGCIVDRGTYTITQTSGSWGKLKSGAGWISISTKYVKYA